MVMQQRLTSHRLFFDSIDLSATASRGSTAYSLNNPPVTLDLLNGTTFGINENPIGLGPCDAVTVTISAFSATADDVAGTFTTSPAILDVSIQFFISNLFLNAFIPLDFSLWASPMSFNYNLPDNTFAWSKSVISKYGIATATASITGRIVTSPVPVPAAVWLFGSGLLAFAGFARRKKS